MNRARWSLDGHGFLGDGEEPPREAAEEVFPLVAGLEGQRRQKVHNSEVVLRVIRNGNYSKMLQILVQFEFTELSKVQVMKILLLTFNILYIVFKS